MKVLSKIVHSFVRSNIRNPKFRWFFIVASLAYLVSPLDISPDVFPVVGLLDDGVLITLVASEVSQFLIDRRKARKASESTMDTAKSS
ncbi:MAG: DUF1232 domain-containing protein [Cyanobacteria bacterium RM1_2_2]|nr:DUF1232 domain-containing protein [Cyanobacteria bacterium RM1_2_2]